MASPKRDPLPFEPKKSLKKASQKSPKPVTQDTNKVEPKATNKSKEQQAIPPMVAQKMLGRMAIFCGIPTGLGMLSFVGSYFIVKNDLFPLPHLVVVFGSMGLFAIGFVGLSYGALSASWDEKSPGSMLGWQEFKDNLGRMRSAWQSDRKSDQNSK